MQNTAVSSQTRQSIKIKHFWCVWMQWQVVIGLSEGSGSFSAKKLSFVCVWGSSSACFIACWSTVSTVCWWRWVLKCCSIEADLNKGQVTKEESMFSLDRLQVQSFCRCFWILVSSDCVYWGPTPNLVFSDWLNPCLIFRWNRLLPFAWWLRAGGRWFSN